MDKEFENMIQAVYEKTINSALTDRMVYEFCEQCCRQLADGGMQGKTGSYFEKFWEYLYSYRQSVDNAEERQDQLFRLGRVYSAMELLHMEQSRLELQDTLEDDAERMYKNWYFVFQALDNSDRLELTHKKLAAIADKSDSSLSQFMSKIEGKGYIRYRKNGRTKYYSLSERGKLLFEKMNRIYEEEKEDDNSVEVYVEFQSINPKNFVSVENGLTAHASICEDKYNPLHYQFSKNIAVTKTNAAIGNKEFVCKKNMIYEVIA